VKRLLALLRPVAVAVAPFLGVLLLRAIRLTVRFRYTGFAAMKRGLLADEPTIFAFWHGQLANFAVFTPRTMTPEHVSILVSRHTDGEIIARAMNAMGVGAIRGSSTRGGAGALMAMAQHLKGGGCVAITPDGPRGPRHTVSRGALMVARLSGVRIVPVAAVAGSGLRFSSWDRMEVPLPFSRIALVEGEPIKVPDHPGPEEEARLMERLKEALDGVNAKAAASARGKPEARR
jgi:lysophospholipid acyltransferase (LPLAT)-like uncharacterized protein